METGLTTQSKLTNPVYAYTQYASTIRALELLCGLGMQLLAQDRSKDPVEDVLTQMPGRDAILYAVLPIDKAVELRIRAPGIRLVLMQLDGRLIEQLTGRPYSPKAEYPPEIVIKALKTFEVKGGNIKAVSFEELRSMLLGKTVAVFNDAMRQALQILMPDVNFVKTCDDGDCIEVNPPGNKPDLRVSFPGTAGMLTADQMVELIKSGKARIYYAEIEAVEAPPCP